jgi:peptidoglycan/xylan/chitin deacetylase (PgdA/CDA1 family)
MDRIIIRHDDLDGRLGTAQYIEIHEAFKAHGLIEHGMFQPTQYGRLGNFAPELFDYYKKEVEAGTFVVALHGWAHSMYSEMEYDFIVRDLMAAKYWCLMNLGIEPIIWGSPWNCMSNSMERAATLVGLELTNESNDVERFIREAEVDKFSGKTMYWHGWRQSEVDLFPRMLELLRKIEIERGNIVV